MNRRELGRRRSLKSTRAHGTIFSRKRHRVNLHLKSLTHQGIVKGLRKRTAVPIKAKRISGIRFKSGNQIKKTKHPFCNEYRKDCTDKSPKQLGLLLSVTSKGRSTIDKHLMRRIWQRLEGVIKGSKSKLVE